jgi:hypothetical protein
MPSGRVVPGLKSEPTQLAECGVQGSVEKVRIVGVVEKSELWDTASRRLPGCMQLQLERPSNEVRHVDLGYLTPATHRRRAKQRVPGHRPLGVGTRTPIGYMFAATV